jgi:pimeloyl-ACP methyl ester carboxylesterase
MEQAKKLNWVFLICYVVLLGCKKENTTIGTDVQDYFYVSNEGAKMPVLVEGNTASGIILVWVHGGPGGTSIGFQNDAYISKYLETEFAVAYWDQRAAGGSQGSFTPKLEIGQFGEDLKKVIQVLKHRYGSESKVFILSHSFGGLVAPAFLTEGDNQNLVNGWINVAGAHNYILNDTLTRNYLIQFGNEQIKLGNHVSQWQAVVNEAEINVPDYQLKTSTALNKRAREVEAYIDDIKTVDGLQLRDLLLGTTTAFSLMWTTFNAGSTLVSDFPKDLMHAEYSSKLNSLTLPILCLTGKYDFTCPVGLAEEVMKKVNSTKKKLVILPHSGHICMTNEPEIFYPEIVKFVRENL